MSKVIAIGSDHAGFPCKEKLVAALKADGYDVQDVGPFSADSVDYPDFAHPVAEAVEGGIASAGVLICGSGNGVCMTANKHAGIRAALCWTDELAVLSRQHNDANILCVPARFVSDETALSMMRLFLSTGFEGGRHTRRVEKIGLH